MTGFLIGNLLFRRRLMVNMLRLTNVVLIKGTIGNLIWETSGCYKIKVADYGNYLPTEPGLIINLENDDEIKVTFYGVFERIERTIPIKTVVVSLAENFETKSSLPSLGLKIRKPITKSIVLNNRVPIITGTKLSTINIDNKLFRNS